MTPMKVFFDYMGTTVTATGVIWDSGFVDDMEIIVEDENYNEIPISGNRLQTIRELAEEIMLDKHHNSEVEF
jgi:hypothetical protein